MKSLNSGFAKSFMCIPIDHNFKRWGVMSVDSAEKVFPSLNKVGFDP